MHHASRATLVASIAALSLLAPVLPGAASASTADAPAPAAAGPRKAPTAIGRPAAPCRPSTPTRHASAWRSWPHGGNAADAAVATAAALGVTEPYSAGVGGGGFFVYYDAGTGKVSTIDGRETAPLAMGADAFLDDAGNPLPFDEAVESGLSVGTPGTPLTWARALEEFGTLSLSEALMGGIRLADEGFVVDETFRQQTADNEAKFRRFQPTAELFLPDGALPEWGRCSAIPTWRARTSCWPPRAWTRSTRVSWRRRSSGRPRTRRRRRASVTCERDCSTRSTWRGTKHRCGSRPASTTEAWRCYGMAPPSSGGSTVGEALNILERFPRSSVPDVTALHHYLEASALAFADRNAYVGDPAYVKVPLAQLLSDKFAAERACAIDPGTALEKPTPAGNPDGEYGRCPAQDQPSPGGSAEGPSTTHPHRRRR